MYAFLQKNKPAYFTYQIKEEINCYFCSVIRESVFTQYLLIKMRIDWI